MRNRAARRCCRGGRVYEGCPTMWGCGCVCVCACGRGGVKRRYYYPLAEATCFHMPSDRLLTKHSACSVRIRVRS